MEDVCSFGHQLVAGSDSITIKEIDEATGRLIKEETKLLRRHANSVFPPCPVDPRGIGPAECVHGLLALPVGPLGPVQLQVRYAESGGEVAWLWGAHSWMRTSMIRGVCCLIGHSIEATGEPPPDAILAITPRDGSFDPRSLPAEDLPEWAR